MVTARICTELMLPESGVVQNPLGTVAGFYLFGLTISSSTHSASLFQTSPLRSLAVVPSLLFPFSFFHLPVSLFFFFPCHFVVRPFLNFPSCGSSTGDARSSLIHVFFLCTTTSSVRFISALSWDLTCVTWLSMTSSSLTGRYLSIYSRAELPERYTKTGWWNGLTGALWNEDLTDSRLHRSPAAQRANTSLTVWTGAQTANWGKWP